MAYASATTAQTQTLRDALINTTKLVERVQEGGQSNATTMGPSIDTLLTSLTAAITAVTSAS